LPGEDKTIERRAGLMLQAETTRFSYGHDMPESQKAVWLFLLLEDDKGLEQRTAGTVLTSVF
jgi:hypothetical protein